VTEIYSTETRIEDKTMPAVCYALYLLAFATGITAVIGLVIAYTQRSSAAPGMKTHFTYLIRTFWGGLMMMIVGGVIFGVGALLTMSFGFVWIVLWRLLTELLPRIQVTF
jgi:uncharacterized membrane protein